MPAPSALTVTFYWLIMFLNAGSTNRIWAFYGLDITWLIKQSIEPLVLGVVDYIYLDLAPIRPNTVKINVAHSEGSKGFVSAEEFHS